MYYVIGADTRRIRLNNGSDFYESYAVVNTDRNEANRCWKSMSTNGNFNYIHTTKAQNIKRFILTKYVKTQFDVPVFMTICEDHLEVERICSILGHRLYSFSNEIVIPDIPLDKMEFDTIESLNPEEYSDEDTEYMRIRIVREKTFGLKFYLTEEYARYDEILTNREDVCEIRLHPYCSDFRLVKDIELAYDDYDM